MMERLLKFAPGGEVYVTELYAFAKKGGVVAAILQHAVEEAELREGSFDVIRGGL